MVKDIFMMGENAEGMRCIGALSLALSDGKTVEEMTADAQTLNDTLVAEMEEYSTAEKEGIVLKGWSLLYSAIPHKDTERLEALAGVSEIVFNSFIVPPTEKIAAFSTAFAEFFENMGDKAEAIERVDELAEELYDEDMPVLGYSVHRLILNNVLRLRNFVTFRELTRKHIDALNAYPNDVGIAALNLNLFIEPATL